jgi:hypothetical protein
MSAESPPVHRNQQVSYQVFAVAHKKGPWINMHMLHMHLSWHSWLDCWQRGIDGMMHANIVNENTPCDSRQLLDTIIP